MQYFTSSLTTTVYSTIDSTSTSTLPMQYQSTPFDYNYQTGYFSLYQIETTPTNNGVVDYPCFYYDYFLINATAGHEIRGHFELTQPWRAIHFFILSYSQFNPPRNFGWCGYGNWSWYLHVFAPSYNFDWVVPESGVYALLFLSNAFYGGSIHLTAQDYSTTVQSSMETSTTTTIYTLQSNQIMLSTLTSMSSQPATPEYYYLAPIILIVILAITVSFIILRMKRTRPP